MQRHQLIVDHHFIVSDAARRIEDNDDDIGLLGSIQSRIAAILAIARAFAAYLDLVDAGRIDDPEDISVADLRLPCCSGNRAHACFGRRRTDEDIVER